MLALLEEEQRWGIKNPDRYLAFASRVAWLQRTICDVLYGLKARGRSIAAYGAAAKGSTFLNAFGIGGDVLDFVVDRSTYKQGRYMPGGHMRIYAPERLLQAMPDYVLLLTWNFAEEILAQQAAYRQRGGRFVLAIPDPKIV